MTRCVDNKCKVQTAPSCQNFFQIYYLQYILIDFVEIGKRDIIYASPANNFGPIWTLDLLLEYQQNTWT